MKLKIFFAIILLISLAIFQTGCTAQHSMLISQSYRAAQDQNWDECIEKVTKAIELDGSYAYYYFHRGRCLFQRLHYDEAINDFNKYIAHNPDWYLPYSYRGQAKYYIGEHESAIQDLDQVLKLTPDAEWAYNFRAWILLHMGRLDEALKDASKALKLSLENQSGYSKVSTNNILHTLGRIYLEQDLYDQAIAEFHKAGKARGKFSAYDLIDLSWAKLEKGDLAEARADLEKARALRSKLEGNSHDGKEYLARLENLAARLGQAQATSTKPTSLEPSPEPQPVAAPEPPPQPQTVAESKPTPQPQAAQPQEVKPPSPAPVTEVRTALVIGNAAYKHNPLRNAVNDARAMAQALGSVGFEVTLLENLDQKRMKKAVLSFGRRIAEGGVGLFYFAGHGVQAGGSNYLIPIGASIYDELEVEVESMDAAYVMARMAKARNRLNIVILDACRDNPFGRSFRSAARGLTYMSAPSGTFIAYATAPGTVAADGPGQHSFYTRELINQIQVPGLTIEQVFKRVRAAVESRTKGRQIPWESSSLKGEFYFKRQP